MPIPQKQIDPKDIRILVDPRAGLSFEKMFFLAKEKNERILSNKEVDRILLEPGVMCNAYGRDYLSQVAPLWTGTVLAYARPGRRLGQLIEYEDSKSKIRWMFPVPVGCRELKDSALVVEHPDYDLFNAGSRIVVNALDKDINVIENFPRDYGWYRADEKTAIPVKMKSVSETISWMKQCLSSPNSMKVTFPKERRRLFMWDHTSRFFGRHLYRADEWVGPIARAHPDYYSHNRRGVSTGLDPSYEFRVLVVSRETAPAID